MTTAWTRSRRSVGNLFQYPDLAFGERGQRGPGLRGSTAGKLGHETPGYRGGEHGASISDHPDSARQALLGRILQEEANRTGPQCLVDNLVDIEGPRLRR